jgi:hypothetical protein
MLPCGSRGVVAQQTIEEALRRMGTTPPLWPREYGAYAELIFPLLTALLAGCPSVAGAALALSVVCWFLLYEPLAIARGARGRRQRAALGEAARGRTWWLAGLGGAAGVAGLVLAPPAARLAALVPGAAAVCVLPAVLRGRPKTLTAELLVATALSTMVLPVGLAGRMAVRSAVPDTLVWLLTYWTATLTVHAIKARVKPELGAPWTLWAAPALATLVLLAGLGAAVAVLAGVAVVPGALLALAVAALRVHPRRLKRVGWSLAAANVVTLVLLLAG